MNDDQFRRFVDSINRGDIREAWHALDAPNREVHVIPVPDGMSAEQAWEIIARDGDVDPKLVSWARWAVVEVKDGRMVRWHPRED